MTEETLDESWAEADRLRSNREEWLTWENGKLKVALAKATKDNAISTAQCAELEKVLTDAQTSICAQTVELEAGRDRVAQLEQQYSESLAAYGRSQMDVLRLTKKYNEAEAESVTSRGIVGAQKGMIDALTAEKNEIAAEKDKAKETNIMFGRKDQGMRGGGSKAKGAALNYQGT